MPVLSKSKHSLLKNELQSRFARLIDLLEGRELKSSSEGCKGRAHWVAPESKCATKGSDTELRMAVDDFKTILNEISKLK